MDIQEFTREMVKEAGIGEAAYSGAKALYSLPGMLGRKMASKPGAKLMYESAKGTGKSLMREGKKGYKGAIKAYTKPITSYKQLMQVAKEKGWGLKEILSVAKGDKLIAKGMRSDLARGTVRRSVKSLKRGAKIYGGTAAGAGALGAGAYAMKGRKALGMDKNAMEKEALLGGLRAIARQAHTMGKTVMKNPGPLSSGIRGYARGVKSTLSNVARDVRKRGLKKTFL